MLLPSMTEAVKWKIILDSIRKGTKPNEMYKHIPYEKNVIILSSIYHLFVIRI